MKIRLKTIGCEIELEFKEDDQLLQYHTKKITDLIDKSKETLIELETKLKEEKC